MGDKDPNHPYFQLIGRITVEWGQLEHVFDLIIWDLAKHKCASLTDNLVACITAQVKGPTDKGDVIVALAAYHCLPEWIGKRVKRLYQRCNEIQKDRNRIAHDSWFIEVETKDVGRFRKPTKKELEFGVKPEDDTRMKGLIAALKERQAEALQLREDVARELAALSGTF